MPLQEGQLCTSEWSYSLRAEKNYKKDAPLSQDIATLAPVTKEDVLRKIIGQIRGMLNEAHINIGTNFKIELSHHYGLESFREFGAILIDCFNRAYAKKLIIQLPRQKHPYHYHKIKEETFHVLFGDLQVEVEGNRRELRPGDFLTVLPGQWHKFQTSSGVIFEEISTTNYRNDSIYDDKKIQLQGRENRKTFINFDQENPLHPIT